MKTWAMAASTALMVLAAGCGGGGDSGAGNGNGGGNNNGGNGNNNNGGSGGTSTQFTAASYTVLQRSKVTAASANPKTDGAGVSNNTLSLDGASYALATLSDGTVIPTGLSQATDGANAAIECKGTAEAYILFAQTAAGTAAATGSYADLAGKKFQEYECISGSPAKDALLTFDSTGNTILTAVKNGATMASNVATSQLNPLVYKVGGKVFLVEYGLDGTTPYLILGLPQ